MRCARAVLAERDTAEKLYEIALDANLTTWPLERARLLLT